MNILQAIAEIGVIETSRVVSESRGYMEDVPIYLPDVDYKFIEDQIKVFLDAMTAVSQIFMMLPEIALLEAFARIHWSGTAILAITHDMDDESKGRVYANMPDGVQTEFVLEGDYPKNLRPDNGIIVCTGIATNRYRQYIMPSCCRLMSLYKAFRGNRILLSCFPKKIKIPEFGWTYAEPDFFTNIITEGEVS